MAKKFPKFSADPAYRKKTVGELSKFLERMNKEWKQAEEERETGTRAKAARGQNDEFQYTDVDTSERIPASEYQERYLRHTGLHNVNPIIRMMPATTPVAAASAESALSAAHSTPPSVKATIPESTPLADDKMKTANSLSTLLGFDISKSCIIDDEFYEQSRLSLEGASYELTCLNIPRHGVWTDSWITCVLHRRRILCQCRERLESD